MKRGAIIFLLSILFFSSTGQKVQTIVPEQIIAGNAFQIQYIISGPSGSVDIIVPQLENLKLISGPNYYKGNSLINGSLQPIQNISFTIVALKEGLVRIKGTTVSFGNMDEKTEDIVLNVLPPPKASFNAISTYTDLSLYAPASKVDTDKIIEENLFIKTEVSKRACFLGEAITATFKLYSRLQSTSEVLNAPSLYGFSVMDVFNVNEVYQSVEMINGKIFNTSVLRKLQLYPAQTGTLTVDAMQLQNEIEFEDSVTGKKIKVEKLIASKPVEISVRPLPAILPDNFTGAVGKFDISATLKNPELETDQQGKLIVRITGRGNFLQFAAPSVEWPDRFEVFDPLTSDNINKNIVPAEGVREYSFMFTPALSGNFMIPPVSFSFFDPQSRTFKKVQSDSLKLIVTPALKKEPAAGGRKEKLRSGNWLWISLASLILLVVAVFLFRIKRATPVKAEEGPDYAKKLQEAVTSKFTDKQFCLEVQKLLNEVEKNCSLSPVQKAEIHSIKADCQLLIYSDVTIEGRKKELEKRAAKLFQELSY